MRASALEADAAAASIVAQRLAFDEFGGDEVSPSAWPISWMVTMFG